MATATPKTVLITGASTGIGKATAELFAAAGWNVAATMRNPASAAFGTGLPNLRTFALDVTEPASIERAVSEVIAAFGAIDVVVNNAGYSAVGPFEAQSPEQVRAQFETNVFGVMAVTRAVLPHMRARRQGRIVNVASMCGRMTLPLYTIYCATKWAVDGFSEALAFEVAGLGIKVKIIEPGVFRTDFFTRSQQHAAKPGLTDYDTYVETVLPNIAAWETNAPPPDQVARSILTAATDRIPRMRYTPRSGVVLAMRRFVPGSLYVRAVRRALNAW